MKIDLRRFPQDIMSTVDVDGYGDIVTVKSTILLVPTDGYQKVRNI